MLRTGMRKGEMQGLKYSDIDKKQNVIHVRRTLKYIEGKGYFEDTPKTRTYQRHSADCCHYGTYRGSAEILGI